MSERLVTFDGQTLSVSAWSRTIGIHKNTLTKRLNRGYPLELALSTDTQAGMVLRRLKPAKRPASTCIDVKCSICDVPLRRKRCKAGQKYFFCSRTCQGAQYLKPLETILTEYHVDSNGCWIFTGYTSPDGYGRVRAGILNKGYIGAHVAMWLVERGPIPKGLWVLHNCDNPPCINPDHLFLGDQADNNADCLAKGRNARGEKAGLAKLTEGAVRAIRDEYSAGGVTLKQLGEKYSVDHTNISSIVRWKTWRHIV